MKDTFKTLISIFAVFFGVMLIIHRHVIAALLTNSEMPEPPQWHKKMFACLRKTDDK